LLEPHLERVDLPLRKQLEVRNRGIDHICFLEEGIASVVAKAADDTSIEVGLNGREGMTGLAVVMGGNRAPHAPTCRLPEQDIALPPMHCARR
jgi:hypothetical protein